MKTENINKQNSTKQSPSNFSQFTPMKSKTGLSLNGQILKILFIIKDLMFFFSLLPTIPSTLKL